MKNLTVINQNGQLLVDSREVAGMIGARQVSFMKFYCFFRILSFL
ncbi:hypothetical protein FB479_101780 [Brevibacillus sp. AG162]|nr:hypothetical protein FB479_101780 [Brevibacillus sp. AG162]